MSLKGVYVRFYTLSPSLRVREARRWASSTGGVSTDSLPPLHRDPLLPSESRTIYITSFTEAATPAVLGASRWLAPEITSASPEANSDASVMESKPANVSNLMVAAVPPQEPRAHPPIAVLHAVEENLVEGASISLPFKVGLVEFTKKVSPMLPQMLNTRVVQETT